MPIMVKLQRRFAYKYKDKDHYKHIVTIPEELMEQLGWDDKNIELEPSIDGKKLVFTKKRSK